MGLSCVNLPKQNKTIPSQYCHSALKPCQYHAFLSIFTGIAFSAATWLPLKLMVEDWLFCTERHCFRVGVCLCINSSAWNSPPENASFTKRILLVCRLPCLKVTLICITRTLTMPSLFVAWVIIYAIAPIGRLGFTGCFLNRLLGKLWLMYKVNDLASQFSNGERHCSNFCGFLLPLPFVEQITLCFHAS